MPFLFINHNVINDYQHINIKSEKQFGIIPSYIIAHYLFKAMGLVDDDYAYELNKINYVMLQVYPYVPLINSKVLGKVFLALSRGNRHDVRIRSSFDELESEILTELND